MAETAVARRGASIVLPCRAFGVSEASYRYGPQLCAENEEIAGSAGRADGCPKDLGVRAVLPAFTQREGPATCSSPAAHSVPNLTVENPATRLSSSDIA